MMKTKGIMKSIGFMIILLLHQAQKIYSLKCQLVALITDDEDEPDRRELKCQVGDRMLPIENHLDEFKDFLNSYHAENPSFDFDFDKAAIVDHAFHIPSHSNMFYDRIKIDYDSHHRRRGRRLGGKDPQGDQRVLVLYVEDAAGNTPSYVADGQADSVEDNVFGTYSDPIYPGERVSSQ